MAIHASTEIELDRLNKATRAACIVKRGSSSLRQNVSWTLSGNAMYAACQWGLLVAIARLGSVDMVGQFALALAVVTPIFALANLNLRSVQVTDVEDRYQPRDYISLRFLTALIAFTLSISLPLVLHYSSRTALVIAALACVKASESLSDVLHGIQHKRERMKAIAIARALRGLISLVSITLLLAAYKSLPTALLGLAAVNALVLLTIDLPIAAAASESSSPRRFFSVHFNIHTLAPLALLSLPVGLYSAALALGTNLPRYLIAHYLNSSALAYYAAAAYLLVATDLIVRSAHQTALPRLAAHFAKRQLTHFCRLTYYLMLLGMSCTLPLFLIVSLGGETILTFIYGPEYRHVADVFFWLMVANVIWHSSVPTVTLLAMKCHWSNLALRIATTLVIAITAALLIPRFGLIGAAWAVTSGKLFTSIGAAILALITLRKLHLQKRLAIPSLMADTTPLHHPSLALCVKQAAKHHW